MGLDITFYKAKRLKDNETKERFEEISLEEIRKTLATEYIKSIDERNSKVIKELEEEKENTNPWNKVAYFRKVNFLIPFFGYEENCSNIEIDKYQVEDLIEACKEVLANHDKASFLLPTQAGLFFGSTDYDDLYFDDVQNVKEKFEEVLADFNMDEDILIMHCWW